MKTLYFHIGFPKTGTTSMYEFILPYLRDVAVFAPNTDTNLMRKAYDSEKIHQNETIKRFVETFMYSDKYVDETKRIFHKTESDKIFLTTVNLMAGNFFEGLYARKGEYISPMLVAERIKATLGNEFNIKIIIVVRQQGEWIHSAFAEWHDLLPYSSGCNNFQLFLDKCLEDKSSQNQTLNYFFLGEVFEKTCGPGNVKFLLYESLRDNPQAFYDDLFQYMDSKFPFDLLSEFGHANNRSVDLNKKVTDKKSLLLVLFGLKMRYFPNVRLGIQATFPYVIRILNKVVLKPQKNIFMEEYQKRLVIRSFVNSNMLFFEKYFEDSVYKDEYLKFNIKGKVKQ